MNLIEVEEKIVLWSHERGILTNGKSQTQALKLGSEYGELCDNLIKGKSIKDDIGDMFVVLTNLARLEGTTLVECANMAYEDIKDRKGFLNEQGNFIKTTDTSYNQALLDFKKTEDILDDRIIAYTSLTTSAFIDYIRLQTTCNTTIDIPLEDGYTITSKYALDNYLLGFVGKEVYKLRNFLKSAGVSQ